MTAIAEQAQAARRPGVAASNARRLTGLLICLAVLLLAVLASIAVGSRDIPLPTVIDALFAYDDSNDHAIVQSLRLPRTLLGLLIGAALGISGALIQALTRNPLADPGILGVNAGASFFVLIAVGYLGMTSLQSYIWFAFLGAIVTTVMVYAVGSSGRNGATPVMLTLAGVAIGAQAQIGAEHHPMLVGLGKNRHHALGCAPIEFMMTDSAAPGGFTLFAVKHDQVDIG